MASQTETPKPTYTLDDLKAAVAAGMTIAEAKGLLEAGYAPADVLELAQLQAEQRAAQATEQQTATAKAMQKAMRPENEKHPGFSSLAYPEGEEARPRTMPFGFVLNGYPCHKFLETEHWREVELMAQTKPGKYHILRKDGSRMDVTVEAKTDADGKVEELSMTFPVSRDEKHLIPPKISLLYQIVHAGSATPRENFIRGMQEYMDLTVWE